MGLDNQVPLPSKFNRIYENTNIHNIYIFNRSGICFYEKNFTTYFKTEKNLISPFITALMSFSQEMIGKKFRTIEMGDVKFVIFERGKLIYNILCDTIENEMFLEEIISKIDDRLSTYIEKVSFNIDGGIVFDSKLNEVVDNIIDDALNVESTLNSEEKIIEYMKELKQIDEIDGTLLLTDKGKVIYSSYPKISLKKFLKEVDFRVKICNNSILKLFYTFKDRQFIFSEYIQNKCFIILVFNAHTKFGMAACHLNQVVNSVKKFLLS